MKIPNHDRRMLQVAADGEADTDALDEYEDTRAADDADDWRKEQ